MNVRWTIVALTFVILLANLAEAAERARPPEWSRDVLDTFFSDAREKLDGPRPNYEAPPEASPFQRAGRNIQPATTTWSHLISPTTLETEVKRLSAALDAVVTTPSAFKAGGYKAARRDFSELAVLFAVIAQYDGDVRWKAVAAGMRTQFARAGFNAKVGSDQTFREADARKQDLAALVRGVRPETPQASATVDDWSKVSARPLLMQRLEIAHEERLTKWLADEAAFRRNRDKIQHEAQIVALLAEVIHCREFEYWDDELFVEYACTLRDAATDTAAAASTDDHDRARAAIDRARGACSDCHAGYRG